MFKQLTQEEFLAKAVAAHGVGRYDYSRVVYRGAQEKVIIICAEHGPFEQVAASHCYGYGCKKCGLKNAGQYRSFDTAGFITKATVVHGLDTYDYSQVNYFGQKHKVIIICPEHGPFEQNPTSHLAGSGCPICAIKLRSVALTADNCHFISKARAKHGNKYDYSQVTYTDCWAKVKIGCPAHGLFEQVAIKHSSGGHGCPKCARDLSKGKSPENTWLAKATGRTSILYFIKLYDIYETFYKVGITLYSVKARYYPSNLSGYKYEILATHKSLNPLAVYEWERSIIQSFAHLAYRPGRYFLGETECFSSCEEILAIFPL